MNTIVLIGRLTADPESRTSASGLNVTTFTLAVDRRGKEKKTDFFRCVSFGKTAELIERYIKKGNRLAVEGSMQSEQYEDKNGKTQTAWKVVCEKVHFCESSQKETPQPAAMEDDDFPF